MRDNDCTAYGSSSDFNCFADEKQEPKKSLEIHKSRLQLVDNFPCPDCEGRGWDTNRPFQYVACIKCDGKGFRIPESEA